MICSRFNFNRKKLYIVFGVILILILSLTIAFAALSVTLNISGHTEITAAGWDIHLENSVVKEGSATVNVPTIVGPTKASFSTELSKPGDYYEFTIDLVNSGGIDAIISDVVKVDDLTEEQMKYVKYSIEYDNPTYVDAKLFLGANSSLKMRVIVEFRTDISASELPTSTTEINLSFNIICLQSNVTTYTDENGDEVYGIVDGSTYVKTVNGGFYAVPGMTLYDAILNYSKNLSGYGVNEFSAYNLDAEWIYMGDDGRRLNLKNTRIVQGECYDTSFWNFTLGVNDKYASDEKYNTVLVEPSKVTDSSSQISVPILAGLDDTYLNVVHAVYPSFFTMFADASSIASREQEIILDYIVGYPAGQAGGCGTTTEHEFYWITDKEGNLINLSTKVNHLDSVVPNKFTIDEEEMTFDEAVDMVIEYYYQNY